VGLKSAGIVTSSESTFITLGDMHEPGVLLSLFGILLTSALLVRKVTGSLLIGILVTTIIGIPLGITNYGGIISTPPSIEPIFWQFEWHNVFTVDMIVVVLTFLFIDMFDTIGTLIGVSNRAGMVDDDGNVKNLNQAFMADAIGTTIGAMLGTSTVTTYVESASGVNVGGRSGLTSLTTAVCFAVALLFAPLFLAIPAQATAAALILVGVMMMYEVRKVDFSDYVTGIPCFICIVLMPLTYSISDGILLGVISYVLIHLFSGTLKDKDERNNINWATILLATLFVCRYAFL
jgi:AGZA family xanthine/uracil permease-like MFS transporter